MSVRWWSAATQGEYALWSPHDEAEGYDRTSLRLPGMQEGLLQHLARLTHTPGAPVCLHEPFHIS